MASAVIPNRPLVLLDLNDEYKTFDNEPNGQMLNRFIERSQCLRHISQLQENISSQLHWFVPDSEHNVIGAGYVTLTTVYYIYCSSNETQRDLEQQYRMPSSVNIFRKNLLSMFITKAIVWIALDRAARTYEPDEQCSHLDNVINGCLALADEAKQQMQEKFGVEALDIL